MARMILTPAAVVFLWLCPIASAQQSGQTNTISEEQRYVRSKDPKWYAKQLDPLQRELIDIDRQIRVIRQARKGDARATTGAVELDKDPESADTQADLQRLQERRTQVLQRISEIEDEARRNEVAPGAVRAAGGLVAEGGTSTDANHAGHAEIDTPEIVETKEALRIEKEHLERAKNEANLLERKLNLDKHTVYSSPEYTVQKSGKAKLTVEKRQIDEKHEEIQQTEQKVAELEERLQDLRLHSTKSDRAENTKVEEKDEAYWRKQFADMHYKIRMAQSELDILQRELNEGLLVYDPNPQKAMRENVTRKNINVHRQAIEDKKKEIAELRKQLSDLEDDLRHAGGDPGWSRE